MAFYGIDHVSWGIVPIHGSQKRAHLRLWPGRILRRVGHVFILWDRRSSHPWVQHGAASNLGRFANPNGLKSMEKYGQKPTIP